MPLLSCGIASGGPLGPLVSFRNESMQSVHVLRHRPIFSCWQGFCRKANGAIARVCLAQHLSLRSCCFHDGYLPDGCTQAVHLHGTAMSTGMWITCMPAAAGHGVHQARALHASRFMRMLGKGQLHRGQSVQGHLQVRSPARLAALALFSQQQRCEPCSPVGACQLRRVGLLATLVHCHVQRQRH